MTRQGVAAVVPALNEAPTIADVVRAAAAADTVDEVIVADGGSRDATADQAARAGARVVRVDGGKGEGMAAALAATQAAVVVFLDGDLTGLRPDHVDRLARPVLDGRVAMTCGLFDRGRPLNRVFLHALPVLTGERALRRELLEALDPDEIKGYRVEAALNSLCADRGLPVERFVLDGMFHRTKERKEAVPVVGFVRKQAMLATAVWSYVSYWMRRRLRPVLLARKGS